MRSFTRKTLKWLLGCTVGLALAIALVFAAFGVIVGRVQAYRVQLQDWVSDRSGVAVEFRSLSARLRLYGPELVFDEAVVRTPDRTHVLAAAQRGSVGFDLWRSIASGRLTAGRFALESPQIGLIRTREGRIQLLGQNALRERNEPFAIEQLPTGRFHVENAVVSFRDEITGRGPWSMSGVNFDLTRSPRSLELRGDASLPRTLGRKITFAATAEGELEQSQSLVSTFAVEGEALDLAGWADVLPDAWPAPETGHGTVGLSGTLRGSQVMQVSANVDIGALTAVIPDWATPLPGPAPMRQPPDNDNDGDDDDETGEAASAKADEPAAAPVADAPTVPRMLSYSRVALGMRARRVDDAWNISVENLALDRPDAPWHARQIEARVSHKADGHVQASVKADRVVLEALWPLLAYLPESEGAARLRALDAHGAIENLVADFRREAPGSAPKLSLQAQLQNVSVGPVARMPGLAGLSGPLRTTQTEGQWQLAGRNVTFELPRLFREPLVAQAVDGTIRWRRNEDGWTIESDDMSIASEDGHGTAKVSALVPADGGSPVLDLSASGADLRVNATRKYIPAGLFGPSTMEWFDRAFVAGRVPQAELVLKGPVRDFPFRNGAGTFLVRGHVDDAVFDYQPGWAPAVHANADLEFHNEAMRIHAHGADVAGLQVSEATAEVADLKEGKLTINAAANGQLSDALTFLKDSPLAPSLGEPLARLSGQGPVTTNVRLYLPFKHLTQRRIDVTARFAGASVSMRDIEAPVRSLNGLIAIRNTLLTSARLRGQWLGGPFEVSVRQDGPAASVLSASGEAEAAQLQSALELPETIGLSGRTDWQVTTTLTSGDAQQAAPSSVFIESTLHGLAVGLPEPLGKSASGARPLRMTLDLEGEDEVLARASVGSVRSVIRVRRSDGKWQLDRGGIRADGVAAALPSHRGLRIEGAVERFVLDDWLALKGSGSGDTPFNEILHAANVTVGEFQLAGYRWTDVRGIMQATDAGWRVDVNGPGAAGQLLIPVDFQGAAPLRATMERLALDKAPPRAPQNDEETDPRKLPSIRAYVADLRLDDRTLGALDVKATRVEQGIRFDSVTIKGPSAQADARGEWLVTPEGRRSALTATITSDDVAATLQALDYSDFVAAKRGELRGDLRWPGGFDDNILQHASGTLSVRAESGQLVAVQPGAGRVLGLFSIAALPRRLALDFTDLTDKGLAFDSVQGDFELRDGNAYTSNLLLRGPAAEIGIAGRTGLRQRDYDQTAVVTGNLGASLPVAGALAGGPVVGAAVLLFSQVFKEPLKGITRGYYRITGPWDDPVVERVGGSAVKVSEQK